MKLSRYFALFVLLLAACAGREPPPPVPEAAPARPMATPTLSALAEGEDAGAEPKDDDCGAGCLAISCRAGRLEQASDKKAQRERAKLLGKLYFECCRIDPPDPACKDPSVVTSDMAAAHRAAGDEGFALQTELSLLNAYRFPKSDTTERVKKTLTERAQAIEKNAQSAPADLFTAVRIRATLGEEKALLNDAAAFKKLHAASEPALWAEVELEVGAHYARAKKFGVLSKHVANLLPQVKKLGRFELELRARALSARAQFELKQRTVAAQEIESMAKDWAAKGPAFLSAVPESEPTRAGDALTALGEALFLRGEEAREKADALTVPKFTGPRKKSEVLAFIQKDVKSWLEKRRKLIDEADKRYREVLDLKPSPPPKWVVHSAARTAQMLELFAAEFVKVPIPTEIEKDPEQARTYRGAVEDAVQPQHSAARAAFKTCQSFARRFDQEDEVSRQCDEWLARNPGSD